MLRSHVGPQQHRQTIFDPSVAAHNGRVVKLIGEGTIVEFGSVVDAVNCAVSIQRANGSLPNKAQRCRCEARGSILIATGFCKSRGL